MGRKQYYEKRSISTALQTYLATQSWTGLTFKEGWKDEEIQIGDVAIQILPSSPVLTDMGQHASTYTYTVQVEAYLESEPRAEAFEDAVMEFMDLASISIVDKNSTVLGSIICDTDSIRADTLPPVFTTPKVLWWRAVIRGKFEAHYY